MRIFPQMQKLDVVMDSKKRKTFLLLVVSLLLSSIEFFGDNAYAQGVTPMGEELQLSIQLDKETYQIGDSVTIIYALQNVGQRSLTILPWGGEYATNWIQCLSTNGGGETLLKVAHKVMYELKLIPEHHDFITLKPGKSFTRKCIAKLSAGAPLKEATEAKTSGFALDFGDSAILFPAPGRYFLQGYFIGKDRWSEEGRSRYGFDNVFVGEVRSKKISLTILS